MNELLNRWLDENNLGKYKKVFDDNDVSFDLLDKLTEEDLRELSVSLGDRKRFFQAIEMEKSPVMVWGREYEDVDHAARSFSIIRDELKTVMRTQNVSCEKAIERCLEMYREHKKQRLAKYHPNPKLRTKSED